MTGPMAAAVRRSGIAAAAVHERSGSFQGSAIATDRATPGGRATGRDRH